MRNLLRWTGRTVATLAILALLAGGLWLVGDLLYQQARKAEAERWLAVAEARRVDLDVIRQHTAPSTGTTLSAYCGTAYGEPIPTYANHFTELAGVAAPTSAMCCAG